MRVFSVYDLMLIPELSHLRMMDFIDTANHNLLTPFLIELGYDMEYAVEFIPSQHRTLSGKVVVGYQVVGDVQINAEFLHSSWCTAEDRTIAAGYRDVGLAADMAASLTTCREYGVDGELEAFDPSQANENEKELLAQIEVLQQLVEHVRGNPYKSDGSRKVFSDWK